MVTLVNAVLDIPARLEDVDRTGIVDLSGAAVPAARREGRVYKLLTTADHRADGLADLRVAPIPLLADRFLATWATSTWKSSITPTSVAP